MNVEVKIPNRITENQSPCCLSGAKKFVMNELGSWQDYVAPRLSVRATHSIKKILVESLTTISTDRKHLITLSTYS